MKCKVNKHKKYLKCNDLKSWLFYDQYLLKHLKFLLKGKPTFTSQTFFNFPGHRESNLCSLSEIFLLFTDLSVFQVHKLHRISQANICIEHANKSTGHDWNVIWYIMSLICILQLQDYLLLRLIVVLSAARGPELSYP